MNEVVLPITIATIDLPTQHPHTQPAACNVIHLCRYSGPPSVISSQASTIGKSLAIKIYVHSRAVDKIVSILRR